MGCFLVPVTEAVVTTVAARVIKSKETKETVNISSTDGSVEEVTKIKFSTKLGWLNKLLWGGSALLAFEHIYLFYAYNTLENIVSNILRYFLDAPVEYVLVPSYHGRQSFLPFIIPPVKPNDSAASSL